MPPWLQKQSQGRCHHTFGLSAKLIFSVHLAQPAAQSARWLFVCRRSAHCCWRGSTTLCFSTQKTVAVEGTRNKELTGDDRLLVVVHLGKLSPRSALPCCCVGPGTGGDAKPRETALTWPLFQRASRGEVTWVKVEQNAWRGKRKYPPVAPHWKPFLSFGSNG